MRTTTEISKHVDEDLTAKARIRNAALELWANYGEDAISMRAIASAASVTVGLVVHHFTTKDGLRKSVEQRIVDMFVGAIGQGRQDLASTDLAADRDAAVAQMLAENPSVVGYLRRALLDQTGHRGGVLDMLTQLAAEHVAALRDIGAASTAPRESSQVIGLMVRQLGELFLQPMIDTMWAQLAPGAANTDKPLLTVRVQEPNPRNRADSTASRRAPRPEGTVER